MSLSYDRYFSPIRTTAKNVLQVGICESIKQWHDYFPNATIYGIDKADVKEVLTGPCNDPRIKLLTPYNPYDENLIHVFKSSSISFDMMLHNASNTLESMCFFATHYSTLLTPTGVLVIDTIADPTWVPRIVEAFPESVRQRVRSNGSILVLDMRAATSDPEDTVVAAVIAKFASRSAVGQKKYGTTLDRTDLKTSDWIRHTQEELMDAILYLERLSRSV